MFRKQLATERIEKSTLTGAQKATIEEVAQNTPDSEDFYEWIRKATDAEVASWADDTAERDKFGHLDNEVKR